MISNRLDLRSALHSIELLSSLLRAGIVLSVLLFSIYIGFGVRSQLSAQSESFTVLDRSVVEVETLSVKEILNSLPKSVRRRASLHLNAVLKISEFHHIDPLWVLSVMWTESHFDENAKSKAGARGLMQLMPKTRQYLVGRYQAKGNILLSNKKYFSLTQYYSGTSEKRAKASIKNVDDIEIAIIYLKYLKEKFQQNMDYAVVAYNMGPTWTTRRLKRNKPVGTNNHYLNKVQSAFEHLSRRI